MSKLYLYYICIYIHKLTSKYQSVILTEVVFLFSFLYILKNVITKQTYIFQYVYQQYLFNELKDCFKLKL